MSCLQTVLLLAGALALAQDAQPPIRISVTVVQVDAVVTGREGRPVTGLTRDDFEIIEDGKPRALTHVSYVRTVGGLDAASQAAPQVPSRLQREQVGRTIAIVVDDLKMSLESIVHARDALHKFIDTQIAPGDMVAVISTSGGVSALQQFTTDRKMLHAAVGRIRLTLGGGGQYGSVRALGTPDDELGAVGRLSQRRFAVGTLGAIRHVAQGMRRMPGRRMIVLFGDGFAFRSNGGKKEPLLNILDVQGVADGANRSAVVIHSIDTRGLPENGLQAQDDTGNMEVAEVREALRDRETKFRDNQQGLHFLAAETGGTAQFYNNDLNAQLARVLESETGYYLLSFQLGEQDGARALRDGKYHRLTIKVKRPGLRVRYRNGYMGGVAASIPEPRTPAGRLFEALNSPFAGNGLHLRLTAGFALGENNQPVIRTLLHIGGGGLTFAPAEEPGIHSATLHLVAVTEGESGRSGGATERIYAVRVKQDAIEDVRRGGVVYALQHPVKPGAYQMRVAVMDQLSGLIGSANRFVDVPDTGKGTFAMSGLAMGDGDWRPATQALQPTRAQELSPAVRVFRRDAPFSYAVTVYNARLHPATGQPDVELQARLIRDGKVAWEGRPFALVYRTGMDPRRIPAGGMLTLGDKTAEGEYLLELQAVDRAAKRTAQSQWIDFELR